VSVCSDKHKKLNEHGYGKCSVPMWRYPGVPAGFCNRIAFGEHEGRPYSYTGYVPFLACYAHGGPKYNKATQSKQGTRRHHKGDPCIYCGTLHDEVAAGPCPAR
jgi:hypothetical protein